MPTENSTIADVLSPRDQRLCELLADGLANKEIAHEMNLTSSAVRDYVHRACKKTKSRNRVHLAVRWIQARA